MTSRPAATGTLALILVGSASVRSQAPPTSCAVSVETAAAEAERLGLAPLNPADDLERVLLEEGRALDAAEGFTTPVWISRSARIAADPALGITLNRDSLAVRLPRYTEQQFREVVQFFLAHEKAHMRQFCAYGPGIRTLPPGERLVYEAQADILAGKYLFERLPPETLYDEAMAAIEHALTVSFELGEVAYVPSDHPSHDQRRSAVRLGMVLGIATRAGQVATLNPTTDAPEIERNLRAIWRYDPNDTMGWTLQMAHRVVNYGLPALADLVLADSQVDFDTSRTNPFVTYQLTYENTGPRAINVDLVVQSVATSREDPDNTLKRPVWGMDYHAFRLAPGESRALTGTMQWGADAEMMPRFIAPPTPPHSSPSRTPTARPPHSAPRPFPRSLLA